MRPGFSFLKSKIARRFCTLFILCAFVPTIALVVVSYTRVVSQIEEQSYVRLKREAKAYGLGLFDRLLRLENELYTRGKQIQFAGTQETVPEDATKDLHGELFSGITMYSTGGASPVSGNFFKDELQRVVGIEHLHSDRPFLLTLFQENAIARVFMGVNFHNEGKPSFSLIGEISTSYLWGVGVNPLLPPMIELSVFDSEGRNIMATADAPKGDYRDLEKKYLTKDLRIFEYRHEGEEYFASFSNLFIESRFQRTGWIIMVSQARSDIMSALDGFKASFPLIILLFLLLILYLSFSFIRKGLEPLEELKRGTRRIAEKDFSVEVDITSKDEFEELGNAFNDMSSKLSKQFTTLEVLGEIERAILSSFDRVEILKTTLHRLKQFFACDACLYLKKSKVSEAHLKFYKMTGQRISDPQVEYCGMSEEIKSTFFPENTKISTIDIKGKGPLLHELTGDSYAQCVCLPISIDGQVNRALLLVWKEERVLGQDQLDQARQIANQLAVALKNSMLLEDMESLATGTIEALARTVDAKSRWTAGHSERVAGLSALIARAMGYDDAGIETITRAGLLHDIGKIGIPLAILDKPERLSESEYEEVKKHSEIGAKILEPIEAYKNILPLVAQHHEKYDGTGYPDGLKGEDIDLGARILSVADVWDAVASDRPYRAGWVHERAEKLIVEGAGTHFDPDVVDAFLAVISKD